MSIAIDYTSDTITTTTGTLAVANNMNISGNIVSGNIISSGVVSSAKIKQTLINSNNTYTLSSNDNGTNLYFNSFNPTIVSVPPGLTLGFRTILTQVNTGSVTVVAGSGVTIHPRTGTQNQIVGQYASASLVLYATNTFILDGAIQ